MKTDTGLIILIGIFNGSDPMQQSPEFTTQLCPQCHTQFAFRYNNKYYCQKCHPNPDLIALIAVLIRDVQIHIEINQPEVILQTMEKLSENFLDAIHGLKTDKRWAEIGKQLTALEKRVMKLER